MVMLPGWRVAKVLLLGSLAAGLAAACGDSEGPPGAAPEVPIVDSGPPPLQADTGYMAPVGATCTKPWQDCKVLLPAHGSIHPCFVGIQVCTDGKWGPCIDKPEGGLAADAGAVN